MSQRSTPHQCSFVHVHTSGCIVFIHMNLLSASARGTTQHNRHMWTCAEHRRARVLKQPEGKWALHQQLDTYSAVQDCSTTPKWRGIIVQSADIHVLAFYASSVQLGTHPHMWLHCIYTHELALTKRTRYNTTDTCAERHRAKVLKRPQGKWALHHSD